MKWLTFVLIVIFGAPLFSQSVPDLPLPIGAATAQVWNEDIYLVGGASQWWGFDFYDTIYRLENNNWVLHDSIPDANSWGVESVVKDNHLYVLDGWPEGAGLLREYNLQTNDWAYLPSSTNWGHWGNTVQLIDNTIYLFNIAGFVYSYSMDDSTWSAGTKNPSFGNGGLRSITYDDEIYIIGYYDYPFYKYSPANDSWEELPEPPYPVAGCAIEVYNGQIFFLGGSENGGPGAAQMYRTAISFDIESDTWKTEDYELSDKRIWMASVIYNDSLVVIGGLDSLGNAVDDVEAFPLPPIVSIVSPGESKPESIVLHQNYPNPFNPSTVISLRLPVSSVVDLNIYDVNGRLVKGLIQGQHLAADQYDVTWDGTNASGKQVSSGVYYYRLSTDRFAETKRMILLR